MTIRLQQITDGYNDLTDGPIINLEVHSYLSGIGWHNHQQFHRMPKMALSADGRHFVKLGEGYLWFQSWHETDGAWEEIGYPADLG